jgi:hypothetical protein
MHEGAERRLLEAVLIHKHHARVSPRLIPGSSPRSAALMTARTDVENAEQQALFRAGCNSKSESAITTIVFRAAGMARAASRRKYSAGPMPRHSLI